MVKSKQIDHRNYPRASAFYALANCEASFQLSQASGEEPPTPFSDRGTEVHRILSGKLKEKEADPGLVDEAQELRRQRDQMLSEWSSGKDHLVQIATEKRIWMRNGLKPIYSGQPDEYAVETDTKRVLLSDYKTGWHGLDDYVATNCQIRAYVPLVAQETGSTEITAAIHKPGRLSPPAVFDVDAIYDARDWAVSVAMRAMSKGEKKPNRGAWCKYCAGKVLCPLWRDELSSLAELSSAIASEVPDSMLRSIAPKLHLASEVCERLLERLYERVKARPDFFTDWKFKPGSAKRRIEDTVEAYNQLVVRNQILSPGEFLTCCRLAITETESRIRKARNLSVKSTQELMAEILAGIMEARRGRDVLVYDPKEVDGSKLLEDAKS